MDITIMEKQERPMIGSTMMKIYGNRRTQRLQH